MSVMPYPTAFHEPGALSESIRLLATNVIGFQPDGEPSWRAHVADLVSPLRDAFAVHRAQTEGATGLYAELVQDAPRLAHAVDCMVAEHDSLDGAMARLAGAAATNVADAQTLRRDAMAVLGGLARHRQRGSDLVHEAYATDIGGE